MNVARERKPRVSARRDHGSRRGRDHGSRRGRRDRGFRDDRGCGSTRRRGRRRRGGSRCRRRGAATRLDRGSGRSCPGCGSRRGDGGRGRPRRVGRVQVRGAHPRPVAMIVRGGWRILFLRQGLIPLAQELHPRPRRRTIDRVELECRDNIGQRLVVKSVRARQDRALHQEFRHVPRIVVDGGGQVHNGVDVLAECAMDPAARARASPNFGFILTAVVSSSRAASRRPRRYSSFPFK